MKLDLDINNIKSQFSQMLAKKAPDENSIARNEKIRTNLNKAIKPLNKILGRYSYEHENLVGIDISAHYVRLCEMKNVYGQWTLNSLASTCIESQFRNADIHTNPDLYVENLRDLLIKNTIKTKEAAFTLPTSSSVIKIIRLPEMDDNDFAQAASIGAIWEGSVQLDAPITDYFIYYHILRHNPAQEIAAAPVDVNPVVETPIIPQEIIATDGTITPAIPVENITAPVDPITTPVTIEESVPAGPTMDVLFVATKMSDISLYSDIIRRAGLNPVLADVRCLALKHLFETDPKNVENIGTPYAFMEFGPDENYIFVVDEDNTTIYNLYVSEEDKSVISQSAEDKERLKIFVSNYATQAQQFLTSHEQAYKSGQIKHIFVSSSAPLHVNDASASPLIKTFVEEISLLLGGYKITECDICNHIFVPEKFAKKVNAEGNIAPWASTVGIAARRVDPFEYEHDTPEINKVNIMPGGMEHKEEQRMSLLSLLGVAALLALIIAQICLSITWLQNKSSRLASKVEELKHIEDEYNSKFSESQRLSVVMTQVKSLDSIKDSLPSNQSSIISAYTQITQVIPEGVWLTEINYTLPDKIKITGSSINDSNILEFVNRLNDGKIFQKVSLKTMNVIDASKEKDKSANNSSIQQANSNIKNFSLEGSIIGNSSTKNAMQIISGEAKHGN